MIAKNWFRAAALLLVSGILSCEEAYVPYARPYGFPRLELPDSTSYVLFESVACPFTFEYPSSGRISRNQPDSCWVDIAFPGFDGTLHVNSRHIPGSGMSLEAHQEEHRRLIYNHSVKATRIVPAPVEYPAGKGVKYEMTGEVGTPIQLFFHNNEGTESVIMSFYYQTAVENDSLAPVTDYMKGQIDHLMQSFRWK